MDSLQQYYLNFIQTEGAVEYVNNIQAAHTQPTNYQVNTNPCSVSQSPYLSYCSYDGAGDALNQIFNNSLNPLNTGFVFFFISILYFEIYFEIFFVFLEVKKKKKY